MENISNGLARSYNPNSENGQIAQETNIQNVSMPNSTENYWSRRGLHAAIAADGNPLENLKKLLNELLEWEKERLEQIEILFQDKTTLIENNIKELEANLNQQRENRLELKERIPELEKLVLEDEEKLKGIKAQIYALLETLNNDKRQLVDDAFRNRLEEVSGEIEQIIKNHKILGERKYELDKEIFDSQEEVRGQRKKRLKEIREKVKNRYDKVLKKIEALNKVGIEPSITGYLFYVGIAAVICSGWFFSSFSAESNRNFDTNDYVSLFIQKIFEFGNTTLQITDKWLMFAYLLLGLLGLLFLIGFIAWVCQLLLNKFDPEEEDTQIRYELDEDGGIVKLKATIQSKSALGFWLKLIPYIFIVGTTIILFALAGVNEKELSGVSSSLASELMGVAITLVISGIILLYINFIIEPRILKQGEKKDEASHPIQANWELVVSLILFLLSIVLMGLPAFIPNFSAALVAFLFTSIFAGFTIGYSLKYRGLMSNSNYLEKKFHFYSSAIERASRPRQHDMRLIETDEFRKEIKSIQEDLSDLVKIRNEQVKGLYYFQQLRPGLKRFFSPFSDWFQPKERTSKEQVVKSNPTFSTELFPHHHEKLRDLISERDAVIHKIKDLEEHILSIRLMNSDEHQAIEKTIEKLEKRIEELKSTYIEENEARFKKVNDLKVNIIKYESNIREGFELGRWYLSRGLSPNGLHPISNS